MTIMNAVLGDGGSRGEKNDAREISRINPRPALDYESVDYGRLTSGFPDISANEVVSFGKLQRTC